MRPTKNRKRCVYAIRNIENQKSYIGSTADYYSRIRNHINLLNLGKHYNIYLQTDWILYGEENFECFKLDDALEWEESCSKEQFYLDTYPMLYNIANKVTEVKPMPESAKIKLSNKMQGVVHSEETRRKISETLKMHEFTPERRENISKALTGRKLSKAHREAIAQGNTGKKMSAECIAKRKKKRAKPVYQLDLEGNIIKEWESLSDARKSVSTNIGFVLAGQRETAGGYKWQYKNT